MKKSAKQLVKTALCTALIVIASPFSINLGAVPVSLSSLAIFIAVGLLNKPQAIISVVVYILLGLIGLPVFSGFQGGVSTLFTASGGYIIGYLPCAIICALICKKGGSFIRCFLSFLIGTLILYAFGTVWYSLIIAGNFHISHLAITVLPFVVADFIKITVASLITTKLSNKNFI